jgi:hypothetical protein
MVQTPLSCNPLCHPWDRRREVIGSVECVIRVCYRCGRKELCWSRRPLRAPTPGLVIEPPPALPIKGG